jgi:hypothetical protein
MLNLPLDVKLRVVREIATIGRSQNDANHVPADDCKILRR